MPAGYIRPSRISPRFVLRVTLLVDITREFREDFIKKKYVEHAWIPEEEKQRERELSLRDKEKETTKDPVPEVNNEKVRKTPSFALKPDFSKSMPHILQV